MHFMGCFDDTGFISNKKRFLLTSLAITNTIVPCVYDHRTYMVQISEEDL